MKHNLKLLFAAIIAMGLPLMGNAVTLTQAQITQIIQDVRTIDPSKGSRRAVMKETIQGDQSVRTGIDSRTELLFNDHSITRLGANTHFSFSEGTRNMSLQSGVMLLQVPKGIGGAKIETPAVTAGITGTTIMLDYGKVFTKLIVLEGECWLWFTGDKQKFPRKVRVRAGQEIIVRNASGVFSTPFYVNLKILESTSLLLTGKWSNYLNYGPIIAAANKQRPSDYVTSTGGGAGVNVVNTISKLPQTPPQNNSPPTTTTAPATPPSPPRNPVIP